MTYFHAIDEDLPPGALGCGGNCGCARCRQTAARLGERYIEGDDDQPQQGPASPAEPPRPMRVAVNPQLGMTTPFFGAPAGTVSDERKFLDQVRSHPAAYRQLLLTVIFHPNPQYSFAALRVGAKGSERKFVIADQILMLSVGDPGVFIDELRRIAADFQKRDTQFNRQVDNELKLRGDIFRAPARRPEDCRRRPPGSVVLGESVRLTMHVILSGGPR